MPNAFGKKKIAILGGGTGALTAAFGITEDPNWQDQYEITVYQVGWRLGGKGASGRNPAIAQRIEEHGLHVWGGFYENAFWMIKKCYQEMGRPAGAPLATWQDAFKPHSFVTLEEFSGGAWHHWNFEVPTNSLEPGTGPDVPTPWEYVELGIQWLMDIFSRSRIGKQTALTPAVGRFDKPSYQPTPGWVRGLFGDIDADFHDALNFIDGGLTGKSVAGAAIAEGLHPLLFFLRAALNLVRSAADDVFKHLASLHHAVAWLISEFEKQMLERFQDEMDKDQDVRRTLITINLGCSGLRGLLLSGILLNGFFSVDDEEWSAWLKKYGAWDITIQSALVRGVYDYVFGFVDGDASRPSLAAGTCLHGLMRLGLTYKGAIFWEMQAGMGDTIFTPLYQVLKKRGVRFEFFQRVKNLGVDGGKINSILLGRQVTLKNPAQEYQPLVDVKGLPCWPSEPLYDQLVEGDELRQRKINLETPWADWKDREDIRLEVGRDFDLVVLGIAIGSFPYVCRELNVNPAWKRMCDRVATVQTQAMQLWVTPTVGQLGWTYPTTILTAYADDQNTYGDLSHLLERECWPADHRPQTIAYFCGPMKDPAVTPPFDDHDFPNRELDRVRNEALAWLPANIGHLWPNAVNAGGFRWDLLVDCQNRAGLDRLNAQYLRANFDPSERYVISLPGSTTSRLKADGSGFDNLYLAGDWVYTAINAGCVEAAVMAGFQASRAINGHPKNVIGHLC